MSTTLRVAVLLLCASAWMSAGAADPERPTVTEIDAYGDELGLNFSEPMLTWLGSTATAGITVQPPLSCDWSWDNDTRLRCENSTGAVMKPATTYRVSIQGGLWSQQGQEVRPQVMSVDSKRPNVDDASILRWENGQPVIGVHTNMAVTAAALKAVLKLEVDAKPVDFELSSDNEHHAIPGTHWRLAITAMATNARSLSLRAQAGLRSIEGDLPGDQEEVLLRARANEPFRLRMVGCSGESYKDSHGVKVDEVPSAPVAITCPAGQQLALEFSDKPSPASLDQWRSQLPDHLRFDKVDEASWFSTHGNGDQEIARPGHFVRLIAEQASSTFSLHVPSTLTSEGGAQIANPVEVSIQALDFLPRLSIAPSFMVLPTGADSPQIFSLVNQPALEVVQHEMTADGISRRTDRIAKAPRNKLARKSPPNPEPDLRKRGGLVDGTVKARTYGNNYSIAYAAFNVTVSKAGHQFVVWVTDWNQANAIDQAKVELIQVEDEKANSVAAAAVTDSDGVAILEVPHAAQEKPRPNLLLRVSRGDRRSVMPLAVALNRHRAREAEYNYDLLKEGERLLWGVADRPLYRPGDVVRYRLWVRERQRNHLRAVNSAGEMKFQLRVRDEGKSISEFSASFDAYGSVTGEVLLPTSLHDNNYCIVADSDRSYESHGTCFRVAGYHVNDLWAELHVDHAIANEGDTVEIDTSAGYFSGGAAVGAKVELQSLLTPLRLEDTYPAYQAFTFIDPYQATAGEGGETFSSALEGPARTDALGHSRHKARLLNPSLQERLKEFHGRAIPFGNLELSASVSASASSWATAPATLKFSRYPRFVGIKVEPWLLGKDADPKIEAVVIEDTGEAVDGLPVGVDVEEILSSNAETDEEQIKVLAHCELRSGQRITCPFRPSHTGRYRFHATSQGAASAAIERYAYMGDSGRDDDQRPQVSLTTANENPTADTTVELVLQQPFAKARVLFSVEHGGVLKHWVQQIDDRVARIPVPVEREWSPGVTINAVILSAADAAFGSHAAARNLVEMASIDLHIAGSTALPLSIAVDRSQVKPGDSIQVTLHNPAASSRQVTLTVIDDASRALAPEFAAAMDPAGDKWLGKLRSWSVPEWYGLGAWPRQPGGTSAWTPSIFDFSLDGNERLETIVVTGSRIRAVDLFTHSPQSDHSLGRPSGGSSGANALRSHFAESAFWKADLVLDAGASQSIDVHLPDNLTRWRVLAWSADGADNFALSEATVQASLPIEVRSEVPTRLFPGDKSIVGARVRAHGQPATITAGLKAQGGGVMAATQWQKNLAADAEQPISFVAQPTTVGTIDVAAHASAGDTRDGVAAQVEVASTVVHQRLPVAGWLPADGVQLKLPALPTGAMHTRIRVEASRGLISLAHSWIDALREYPHRCWEQTLSRAVGAAAATRLGLADASWRDAAAVIEEALGAAGQFQDDEGRFHFFVGNFDADVSAPSMYLTAYTVEAFAFLRSQGFTVPDDVERRAKSALAKEWVSPQGPGAGQATTPFHKIEESVAVAVAIGPSLEIKPDAMDVMWNGRDGLSWSGRANLARVLAARPAYQDRAHDILNELKQAGVKHGLGRVLGKKTVPWSPFYSNELDQCTTLRALWELDHADDAADTRAQFMRGLADLYAGGAPVLDTQASAQCLMTLVELLPATSQLDRPIEFTLSGTDVAGHITLAPHQSSAEWSGDVATLPSALAIRTNARDVLSSFVANVEYDLDGRHAQSAAIGFALHRRYAVMRDHAWKEVPASAIGEGDWVRVALQLNTGSLRRFVAITDTVPGGLRPTDLELAGVSDIELRNLASVGSPYFSAHRIDDRYARFYSEVLPPGVHEIYYYARATQRGHYAALPAVAELMYGSATVSRTNSTYIDVAGGESEQRP